MKLFFWCVNLLSFYWGIAYDNLKFFSCSKLCINRNKPSNACWKKYILSKEIPNSGTWVYIGWLSTSCSSYWQLMLLFFCTFLSPFLSSLKRSTFLQILAIRFIFELLSVFFEKKKKSHQKLGIGCVWQSDLCYHLQIGIMNPSRFSGK